MSLLRRIESARPAADAGGCRAPAHSAARRPRPCAVRRRRRSAAGCADGPRRMLAQVPLRESFRDAKFRIQQRVISDLDPKLDLSNQVEVRREIEETFGTALDEEGLALTRAERARMLEQITDEIVGLGPLEPLLRDETHHRSHGQRPAPGLHRARRQDRADQRDLPERRARDAHHRPHHRRRSAGASTSRARWSTPAWSTARRVNAIIPPISLVGPVLTIRKFAATPLTTDDLIRFGTSTPEMFDFLRACVEARLNIFVSGGTGSGKTTMLNVLSSFIPNDERIVTIEDAAELQLRQEHVVTLETRPRQHRGQGRDPHPRAGAQRPAHAARPHHRRRVPRRRGAGHAPGHEHRPRRLDVDRPRQHARATCSPASRRWC